MSIYWPHVKYSEQKKKIHWTALKNIIREKDSKYIEHIIFPFQHLGQAAQQQFKSRINLESQAKQPNGQNRSMLLLSNRTAVELWIKQCKLFYYPLLLELQHS